MTLVESNNKDVDQTKNTMNNNNNNKNHDDHGGEEEEGFKKEMRDLAEMLSKLNPMAEEFIPSSLSNHNYNNNNLFHAPPLPLLYPLPAAGGGGGAPPPFGYSDFMFQTNQTQFRNINGAAAGLPTRRKGNFNQGKRRMNKQTNMAQREDVIRRTVHVSDIDQQVTEEQLAALFINCGQVVNCRICGDTNSVLRFEFTDEEGARNALSLAGTMLGYYPIRVLHSKTAIAPVNPTFLPRSEDEREMCARTIYCTNIDKKRYILTSEIDGTIQMKSYLSGNPEI